MKDRWGACFGDCAPYLAVIARSPCDEAIHLPFQTPKLDRFAEPVIDPSIRATRWASNPPYGPELAVFV
jgi:hypothetical protein